MIIVERQMSNFPAVSCREQVNFDEIMMIPTLYYVFCRYINSVGSLKTTVRGYICRSTRTHYSDSDQISLYAYYLVLHT